MGNKPVVSKRTYKRDEICILLLQEAFERDLPLFYQMVTAKEGFFGEKSPLKPDWTYTVVVDEQGKRKLIVNIPAKKS
jgi:hypothetical protein